MIRILAIGLFVFAVATGIVFVLSNNIRTGLVEEPAAVASAPLTATPASAHFDATGVIDYYPDNRGSLVPYLVYQDSWGNTATKALLYCSVPAGHYSGSVHVTGRVDAASVCVDSITPA